MSVFADKVRDVVRKIPKGKTMTYKEVAAKAGNTKAARAVGAIMRMNYDPEIPCHRVVRSDGTPGGYNRGGSTRKLALLSEESPKMLRPKKFLPQSDCVANEKPRV